MCKLSCVCENKEIQQSVCVRCDSVYCVALLVCVWTSVLCMAVCDWCGRTSETESNVEMKLDWFHTTDPHRLLRIKKFLPRKSFIYSIDDDFSVMIIAEAWVDLTVIMWLIYGQNTLLMNEFRLLLSIDVVVVDWQFFHFWFVIHSTTLNFLGFSNYHSSVIFRINKLNYLILMNYFHLIIDWLSFSIRDL